MHCRAMDGALGFWTALRDVYPSTREQRCWLHKMANITGAMPKPYMKSPRQGCKTSALSGMQACPAGS